MSWWKEGTWAVMLDFDLASIYEVETKALNQAVKRNPKRFEGEEFMFQLSEAEWRSFKVDFFKSYHLEKENDTSLRSQIVTANYIKKHRFHPYAFTEIGVAIVYFCFKLRHERVYLFALLVDVGNNGARFVKRWKRHINLQKW